MANHGFSKQTFAILGSGMQGTAAAYDLARFERNARVILAEVSLEQATHASERVNRLVGQTSCRPVQLNVLNQDELAGFLTNVDVVLSCVPYWMHPQIAQVAVDTRSHMCDLGGNTEVTWKTLELDDRAKAAGVTLVPDCGLAPGLVNSLGLFLIEKLQPCKAVRLYCGVLPRHPQPPFNYKLTFNIEGLVTEYDYEAVALRDGQIVQLETLTELESLEIPNLGTMEAFTTSGGTSTAPYSLKDQLQSYEYKTIRFPGHCERMRIFKDFGFWGEENVDCNGIEVKPKSLFCKVFGDHLAKIEDTDQCVIRAVGSGFENGSTVTYQVDIHDFQDEETGFSSMERLTGFSLSIIAQHIAAGNLPPGCVRYEHAMTGHQFVNQLSKRRIEHRLRRSC